MAFSWQFFIILLHFFHPCCSLIPNTQPPTKATVKFDVLHELHKKQIFHRSFNILNFKIHDNDTFKFKHYLYQQLINHASYYHHHISEYSHIRSLIMTKNSKRARTTDDEANIPEESPFVVLPPFSLGDHMPSGTMLDWDNSLNIMKNPDHFSLCCSMEIDDKIFHIEKVVNQIASVINQIDKSSGFHKFNDYKIVENTILQTTTFTKEQVLEYSSQPDYVDFYNKKKVSWTMWVSCSDSFLGGYLYNWLARDTRYFVRSTPIICIQAPTVCWFTYSTMFTINLEILDKLIREVIFKDSSIQTHTYERKHNIRKKGKKDTMKAVGVDVADKDEDFALEKIFATDAKGDSVFKEFFEFLRPIPADMDMRNKAHLDWFTTQKHFYKNRGTLAVKLPDDYVQAEVGALMNHVMDQKSINGNTVAYTVQIIQYSLIIAALQADIPILTNTVRDFITKKNLPFSMPRAPRKQTVAVAWASIKSKKPVCDTDSVASSITTPLFQSSSSTTSSKNTVTVSKTSQPPVTESHIRSIVHDVVDPLSKSIDTRFASTKKAIDSINRNTAKQQKFTDQLLENHRGLAQEFNKRNVKIESILQVVRGQVVKNKRNISKLGRVVEAANIETTDLFNEVAKRSKFLEFTPPEYESIDLDDLDKPYEPPTAPANKVTHVEDFPSSKEEPAGVSQDIDMVEILDTPSCPGTGAKHND